ncbi:MAG: BON domain-containing protein [Pirellulales bacterium]
MSCVCPDLVAAATRALEQHPHLFNFNRRGMEIRAERGRVELHGTVRSFYHKQLAQETLLRIDGVDEIDNRLVVTWA